MKGINRPLPVVSPVAHRHPDEETRRANIQYSQPSRVAKVLRKRQDSQIRKATVKQNTLRERETVRVPTVTQETAENQLKEEDR
jgi:hypothetical protein